MSRRRVLLNIKKGGFEPLILYDNGIVAPEVGAWVKGYVYNSKCVAQDTGAILEMASTVNTARASVYGEKPLNLSAYSKLFVETAANSAATRFFVSLATESPELLYTQHTNTGRYQYESINAGVVNFEWSFKDECFAGEEPFNEAANYYVCLYAGTTNQSTTCKITKVWLE